MAKKKVTKKKTAKKTAAAAAKPLSKAQIIAEIAETTDLGRKDVAAVFDAMGGQIKKSLGKRGPGAYTVPGLMKLTVQRKPATKARPGINPFTGEEIMIKAKPARNVVKVRPLKALKEMV